MAKFVLSGPADCPYFAKIEVLAHTLSQVLPDFQYRSLIIAPSEWQTFLSDICRANHWQEPKRSPLIWREPLEYGGPKLYFGSFNEFQEYAFIYYGIDAPMSTRDMQELAKCNFNTRVKETAVDFINTSEVIVTILFAKSPIAYYFLPFLANGDIFPGNQIYLRLYDQIKAGDTSLADMAKEIEDSSSSAVCQISVHTQSLEDALDGAHVVVIFPLKSTMDDLLREPELKKTGPIIYDYAVEDVKILLVYQCLRDVDINLCNLRLSLTPILPPENILVISGVLIQRAKKLLANKLNIHIKQISNFLHWGFSSKNIESFYLDIDYATVENCSQSAVFGPNVTSHMTRLIPDNNWLRRSLPKMSAGQLLGKISDAGETNINSMSMASNAAHMLKLWFNGTGGSEFYSACVMSQGWYDVDYGIFFHFPVTFDKPGDYTVIEGLNVNRSKKYKIFHMVNNYIKHMMEALYERATKVTDYIAALNADQKNDVESLYAVPLSLSVTCITENEFSTTVMRASEQSATN